MAPFVHSTSRDTKINMVIGAVFVVLFTVGLLVMLNSKLLIPILPSNPIIGFAMIFIGGLTLLIRGLPHNRNL